MPMPRSHAPVAASDPPGGGAGKTVLLFLVLVLLIGLSYMFFKIQTTIFKSRFASAFQEKVMDTVQYPTLTRARVKQRIQVAAKTAKLPTATLKSYVTIATKDSFETLGRYYLHGQRKGYSAAEANRTINIPGCSLTDAMPPGLTLRKIAGAPPAGGKNLQNRVQGMTGNDASAVVTGTKARTRAPANALIFAVDLTFTYKFLFFKKKMWFHKRCYFYKKRRPANTSNEHRAWLGIKGDDE